MLDETTATSFPTSSIDLTHLGSEQTDAAVTADGYVVVTQEGNSIHLSQSQLWAIYDFATWGYEE